jgi:hypothetical protein
MNLNLNTIQSNASHESGSAAAHRASKHTRSLGLWLGIALTVVGLVIVATWRTGRYPFRSPRLISITLTPETAAIPEGLKRQYTAIGTYSDRSVRDLTTTVIWNTADRSVAAIDNTGMIRGVNTGVSKITMTFGSFQKSLGIRVTPPEVVALAVSPSNRAVGFGTAVQYSVIGTSSDGSSQTLTMKVQWSSTNPAAVTITPAGVAKALQPGDSVIRATYENITTDAALTVTRSPNGLSGVFASRNDGTRAAHYRNEKKLTLKNVNAASFGKSFSDPVDGYLFAQPLYVPNVTIAGKAPHNIVFAATENNSVYAFDADSFGPPLWTVNLGPPAPQWALPCKDLGPTVGITGTPVIDPQTGTLYVVARTMQNRASFYYLHAVDISTGAEKFGGPVQISASVPGTAEGSVNGRITFDPHLQLQRPGLVLSNGRVHIAFGSICDFSTFHGWIFAYDAHSLAQSAAFVTTPNGKHGGVWQSGAAPSLDLDDNLYVVTGDGSYDANLGGLDFGQTVLKFSLNRPGLSPIDYFTPFDYEEMEKRNMDLGTGGSILLPDQPGLHPHLLITVGKAGTIYVLDRDSLGHFKASSDNQIVQSIPQVFSGRFHSSPAFWQSDHASWIYLGGVGERLKAFSVTDGVLSSTPTSESTNTFGYPGATPVVSSDESSNGIVWAISSARDGESVLNAYDATNLATLLYSSDQAPSHRDKADPVLRFVVPIVANGKVYFGTQNNLDVYGLLR